MKTFIPYTDINDQPCMFDANRVMMIMTERAVPVGNEEKPSQEFFTKVALNENMGFILTKEPPQSIWERIKTALEL